ncbi:Sensory histidine kinase in two-component regulatory system with RstA [Collimonas arenae]|uniref:histidine kinase n=1 Tax=Collimonas arenae TaxID=279058 RepID=A0A0A1FFP8_9BURK|nr:ATP-binding protein [Collimonas arenae]AIY43331.1 Sensory histidine kinase in two-component regulatory system with RstA [Collimonas arenae]
MLRILIRLYLIVAILSIISIIFVQKGFPYIFRGDFQTQMHRDYNTEAMLVRNYLGTIRNSDQEARLAHMNSVSPQRYARLSNDEMQALPPAIKKELARSGIAWNGHGENNRPDPYMALDDGSVLRVRSYAFGYTEVIAYLVVFGVMLFAVWMWLTPHWRDLEKLRIAAARFGDGALDARAKLSDNSSIKQLCAYFNNMADRIRDLITAQRDMVNAASHELRTPLARLEFGLVNLMDTTDDSKAHKRIQAMRKDVEELDILVGELLTLSMLEQSSLPERKEKIALEDFLRSATGVSHEELLLRHTTISWSVDASMQEIVTEPRNLGRAFSNLVRNALRYTRGTIRVRVEARAGSWNLIVEDDGVGIPENERDRIFEPFYRLDRSRDRATGGYGLGLAIVKKATERLGGTVRIGASELGGAMFVMNFPL